MAALALNARPVQARDIRPAFDVFSTLPATSTLKPVTVTTVVFKDPGFNDHLHYILLGVIMMMLVYKMLVIKKPSTKCTRLALMKMPQCPEFLKIDDEDSTFSSPMIQYSFPYSILSFSAPGLQVTNKLNNRNLNLPCKIKMNPWKTMKVHRILLSQFNVYLVCTHMGQAIYHPLQRDIQQTTTQGSHD